MTTKDVTNHVFNALEIIFAVLASIYIGGIILLAIVSPDHLDEFIRPFALVVQAMHDVLVKIISFIL